MEKQVYTIDGNNFTTLDEFWEEVSTKLIPGEYWGRNLDAFNDILRGGFGTPDEGFVLVWKNSDVSRQNLGYPETIKWLSERIERCHPSNKEVFIERLKKAESGSGKTLFDMLVEIIRYEEHSDIVFLLA